MPEHHRRPGPPVIGVRLAGALAILAAVVVALLPGSPAPAGATDTDATAAIDWLQAELVAGGGSLTSVGRIDWGVTTDAVLAAAAAGRVADPAVRASVDQVLGHLDDYSTWDALGPEYAGVRLAGPLAKVLLVAILSGGSAATTGPLETELRSLITATGRLADRNPHGPDASNTFGQALGILALDRTTAGAPSALVDFLLDQQCPDGGFRLTVTAGACTDPASSDSDATAMALQALLVAGDDATTSAARSATVAWLLDVQRPDGSVGGFGPTAAPNANSTGLVAQALRAAGQAAAADAAAAWIRSLQRRDGNDAGAIAYDPTAWTDGALAIPALSRDQWRRATSQAVLALDLPAFGEAVAPAPDLSGSTTTSTGPTTTRPTTTRPTTTTTAATTSTSTMASATSTTSSTAPPSTTTSDLPAPPPSASVLSASRVRAASAGGASLARTGADPSPLVRTGAAALLAGVLLVLAARARRRR